MSQGFWYRSKLTMKDGNMKNGNVHHNEMCGWTLFIGKGWHSFTFSYVNDNCGTSYLESQDVEQGCEWVVGVDNLKKAPNKHVVQYNEL